MLILLTDQRGAGQRGVTLIELMIGIALVGILSVMAIPAFQHWMRNIEVRNAAESISNALQIARVEAIRRNVQIQMVVGPGTGWVVSEAASGTQVQEHLAVEGAGSTSVIFNDADEDGVSDDLDADRVTFNGMGWRVVNNDASPMINLIDFRNPVGGTCKHVDGGPIRCMRITISAAGAARMCDPAVAAGDTRACP